MNGFSNVAAAAILSAGLGASLVSSSGLSGFDARQSAGAVEHTFPPKLKGKRAKRRSRGKHTAQVKP